MIELINGFYIKVDPDQYTLIRQKDGKTKNGDPTITTTVYGYFGNITACLARCRNILFSEGLTDKVMPLCEAIEMLKDLNEALEALIPEEVDK